MTHDRPNRPRPLLSRTSLWVLLAILAPVPASQVPAQPSPAGIEHQVKAAFLYNFAKFVDWPPEAFGSQGAPFVVGVLDDEPFRETLDQVVRGKTVNGRAFEVRTLKGPEEATTCQMVFLGARATRLLPALLRSLQGAAVLTVGDEEAFTRHGGMMNFIVQDNRVRFEVNTDAAARAGLSISSKLLQLANIVRGVRPAEDTR